MVGVSWHQIYKYENGIDRLSASRLWTIASALDAPIEFFYENIGENVPPADALKFSKLLGRIPHKGRSILANFLAPEENAAGTLEPVSGNT